MAPFLLASGVGPVGKCIRKVGQVEGSQGRRDLFDALERVKLSWRVVASPQCRIGVHVHD